ncbi:hypothetical protein SGLAD_v1c04520 [Spiroplasma gladiatoris]|uniref:Uncharacterized protein n=1 Tax=Spiroplasma gladiatoris TaxID=2143 RepID=A0A4P7AHP3_9MOLU|nr:hypothetical protein [Spiroplasma gladiatoris]QBQ07651.1 hypothetical protein SGLAD_v1c04520 [Spiroplasma gladiatoris]
MEIGSNWSTNHRWSWDNYEKWQYGADLKDYLSDDDIKSSGWNLEKAFIKKYKKIGINFSATAYDYYGSSHSASSFLFDTNNLHDKNEYQERQINYYHSTFGVYNEIDLTQGIQIKNGELRYKINVFLGVKGYGAKWQYTSINASFKNIYFY